MKVFISHSWKNKTQAQKIADELKAAGIELWVDANNLLPGQQIQDTIDAVLKDMDVIVLVWSKDASQSDGVAAEVYTSSRLKKMIIPCYLDDSSLNTHPYLSQIKGIHFNDFTDGIGRLKMVLFNYMAREFDMHGLDSIKAMNEFMGSLETANHLIHKEDIKNKGSEADKDFWVNKIQNTEKTSLEKLKEEEKAGKEIMAFLNEKMKQLEAGMQDKKQWQKVLTEMKAHKYSEHPAMRTFIESIQKMYDSSADNSIDDAIVKYKKEMKEKLITSKEQLKNNFGILADFMFATAFENMQYFFLSSADNLEKLLQLGHQQNTHPVIADCANELLQYIKTSGGVIDNNQHGILGYSDDAYFIHSIISALQQEGVINTSSWNIDWVKINSGSEVVFNIAGNHIKDLLDQNIATYCQQLVQKHNPQAAQQPTYQQQLDNLQKAKDDVWKAKLMSLETAMIHNPVY